MSATVTYKGAEIAVVSGNTKTLLTSGKYLEDNIAITDDSNPYLIISEIKMSYSLTSLGLTWISSVEETP